MFTHVRTLLAILSTMAPAAACVGQIGLTFNEVTTNTPVTLPSGGRPQNIYSADLNSDGLTDIVQDVGNSPASFAVSIANEAGTFKAPVNYAYPPEGTNTPRAALAFGDFNQDGKMDLVAAVIGTNLLAYYPGNGDGTFQSPKIYPLDFYATPGGSIANSRMARNGLNLFLTAEGEASAQLYGTSTEVYVVRGYGDGTFAPPGELNAGFSPITQLLAGDFDGDGLADIASSATDSYGNTRITVLFPFVGRTANIQLDYLADYVILGEGDVDGDGRTDLVAVYPDSSGSSTVVSVLYGRVDHTFDATRFTLPPATYGTGSGLAEQIVVADFNDDSAMDFAIPTGAAGANSLQFFLSRGSRGAFTTQALNLRAYGGQSNAVAGIFNRDDKPDVAVVQYGQSGNSVISTELNGTAHGLWSNCPYPLKSRGIAVCSPLWGYGSDGPTWVDFSTTAHSLGQLRDMELWVDGTHLSTQHNAWGNSAFLHTTAKLSYGFHQASIVANDVDGSSQRIDFEFPASDPTCAPPTTAGLTICSLSRSDVGLQVTAGANVNGTLARMEVWSDGAKLYTETTSNSLSVLLELSRGRT